MSNEEELNQEPEEQPLEGQQVEQEESAEQQDPVTSEAKAFGHLSKEEFVAKGGRPEDYKTEKEFVLTGEVIELKKLVQKRDSDIEKILKQHQYIVDQQKANLKAQLEAKLQYAEETGDIASIKQLTHDKIKVEQQEQKEKYDQERLTSTQAADWFKARNATWYNAQNPELMDRCHQVEQELLSQRIYQDYFSLARAVENQMRAELAVDPNHNHLLQLGSPVKRQAVTGSPTAKTVEKSAGASYNSLNPQERAMYDALNRMNAKSGIAAISVKDFQAKQRNDSEI